MINFFECNCKLIAFHVCFFAQILCQVMSRKEREFICNALFLFGQFMIKGDDNHPFLVRIGDPVSLSLSNLQLSCLRYRGRSKGGEGECRVISLISGEILSFPSATYSQFQQYRLSSFFADFLE